jgi:hypothetical protein
MRSIARVAALALVTTGCAPSTPPVTADDYDVNAPLNPRLDDGRLLYRGYDDHHPTCFAFVEEGSDATEEHECPPQHLDLLAACPSGELFAHRSGADCVCDPIGEDPAERVACP